MSDFKIGDRVGARAAVREQMHGLCGQPDWPWYGHIVSIGEQSLIWVCDHRGGVWGLPASELEHID